MGSRLKRRKRNDPPDKWRCEEEHGETMSYKKAKIESLWEIERKLADDIMESLKRNGADDVFKLDSLTKGKGNCFMIAIMQQLRREEVYEKCTPEVKKIAASMNHRFLRVSVYDWVMQHLTHPKIVRMRELYNLDQDIKRDLGEVTRTWDAYWKHMLKDGIWADNWFVQAAAMFLSMDFWILDTTCTKEKPYFQIDGNMEDGELCSEVLYLGLAHESHYQSLILHDEEEIAVEKKEIKEGKKDDDEMIEEDEATDAEDRKEDDEKKIKEVKKDEKEDDCETLDYKKANDQSSWRIERDLADDIMKSLRRNGSDDVFKLDKLTKGEGNGFMIGIMQQLRRDEVYEASRPEVKVIAKSMNHRLLRTSVYHWVMQHLMHPKILRMIELYELDEASKKHLG